MIIQTSILKSEKTINIMKIVGGVIGLSAAAQMYIPVKPVAITFQTIAIMLLGLTYSPSQAVKTVASYIAIGALGLPVFTKYNFGLATLTGPTGGYLVGFLIAIYAMAHFRKINGDSSISTLFNCLLGSLLIYIPGVAWLSYLIGFEKAFYNGFVIFIPTGILKIALLTGIMRFIRK